MSIAVWLYFLVTMLIAVGWIAVGAAMVRRAHAVAGYVMIGAGVIEALATCCLRALRMFGRDAMDGSMLSTVATGLGLAVFVLSWTLVAVALSMLAKELGKRRAPGPRTF